MDSNVSFFFFFKIREILLFLIKSAPFFKFGFDINKF